MAYNITGTFGNDTINQAPNTGPGTIHGLGGNDSILTGNGAVAIYGESGHDTVVLQAGNTGAAFGSTGNDCIYASADLGKMSLYGDAGNDTINAIQSFHSQHIFGGDEVAKGGDLLLGGAAADMIFGEGGADTIDAFGGNDTMVGGSGSDSLFDYCPIDNDSVLGNEGDDTIYVVGNFDTVLAGEGNDSVYVMFTSGSLYYLNQGSDTFAVGPDTGNITVMGGNDMFDGADSIITGSGSDLVSGNGGNDTIGASDGNDTVIGGYGNDSIRFISDYANLIFGDEGNDTVTSSAGGDTVFGGWGNDNISGGGSGGQLLQGDEGNDTLVGLAGVDTLTGGSDADVFWFYTGASDDGDNAATGPVERITDVNFNEDRFQVAHSVSFATSFVGDSSSATLYAAAGAAIQQALTLSGDGPWHVAAAFSFDGRRYLAVDQGGAYYEFTDQQDLLFDITGATGTIDANDFLG